jgi:formate hydrogenlyase subunit 3/multisubunit Na+/H+ antiporter MnhD subunit
MSAPILFIAFPVIAAPIVYLIRRVRGPATTLSVLAAALLGALALMLPLDQRASWLAGTFVDSTWTVLGRVFAIEPGDRLALAFIFWQSALLFLVSGIGETNDLFLPASLANLGLVAAALFVRPFLFAAIFVQLGAALAVFMLAGGAYPAGSGSPPASRGALRLLTYTTLGVPFILLTGWVLDASAANPGDPRYIEQATLFLLMGFAVLGAVVPFHSWVPAVAEHASPFAAAYVFTVMRLVVVFLLVSFLNAYDWLGQNQTVYRALTLGGGTLALAGGALAFGQRNFGRATGYAVLADFGATLLALGLGSGAGVEAALVTVALRGVALPLWALGLDEMRRTAGSDHFHALAGFARRQPLAAGAVLAGMLSLAGFPLTAGFTGRWMLLRLLAQIHPTAAILLLLATVSVFLVCARGMATLLAPATPPPGEEALPAAPISRLALALYGVGFAVQVVLGFFPQALLPAVAGAAAVFSNLVR